jgi:formamidopyrimidine-DNA glycosylase
MPELPEVETIARQLRGETPGAPALVGRTIQRAQALWAREISAPSAKAFERRMRGCVVQSVGRHGKYLIIELKTKPFGSPSPEGFVYMFIHLRMSGRLDVVAQADAYTPHARVVWLLDEGLALRFDDARKFGRVTLVDDTALVLGKLGPDALDISADDFAQRLRAKRGALKSILLDQAFIAGVGNIYADESLFISKLHPRRAADTLSEADALRLHASIRQILLEGIAANGASFDWVYPGGDYQHNFRVYQRTGEPCMVCGRPIERIIIGQRSTHFCAHDQI